MLRFPLPGELNRHFVLIDDADRLLVAGFPWRVFLPKGYYGSQRYACAWVGQQHFYMHRLIAGAAQGVQVDHRNGNGLDNRRFNLRITDGTHNQANRGKQRGVNTSEYKGVWWDKGRQRWMAGIHVDGHSRSLGRFDEEIAAAQAYDEAALEAWGEFARLNFPILNRTLCGLCDMGIPEAKCICDPEPKPSRLLG